MSRAPLENVNITDSKADIGAVAGDREYPPRSTQYQALQALQGESNFVDSSGPIFSMYLEMAEEEDKKMAESWKADAEGMLVFTGLFSAAVASLISVSIQDLQQSPQDTSNFYLANIYQAIANPNQSNISSSLPASPPPFSPPNYAVWVNSLWFLSLVISLTCALLATFLQQWARRYLRVTQTRYSLHKRARVRSFFAEGVEKSPLPLAVEALPALIHVSLFLFFAGLVVFLRNINLTIFKLVLSCVGVCSALYGGITCIPIFRHDSPYYTPLTPLARIVVVVITLMFFVIWAGIYLFVGICHFLFSHCLGPFRVLRFLGNRLGEFGQMTLLAPEKAALKAPSELDARALTWILDRLDEDHELEHFFSGLLGFHNSKVLEEPLRGLKDEQKLQLLTSMIGLLDRTFSSDLTIDQVKHRRADICAKAIDIVDSPKVFSEILRRLVSEDSESGGYGPMQSVDIVRFVRRWDNREGEDAPLIQAIFSIFVARVQQHDDPWFILASKELSVSEAVLREHSTLGDSLSLAILIYITRQQFIHYENRSWPSDAISSVLEAASKFNAQDTSPELQHEFCALWNEIARKAQDDGDWELTDCVLKRIRQTYIILHRDTDSAPIQFSASTGDQDGILDWPSSYPVCNVAGHIHNDSAPETSARTVPRDGPAPIPASLASSPAPLLVNEGLMTRPPLDIPHPPDQTVDSFRVPFPSRTQATVGALQEPHLVAAGVTIPHPTPETSTPLSSIFRPADIALQYDAGHLTPSNPPNLPLSVLDIIRPIESHRSMTAATAPSTSSASAPDPGTSAEDDGGPMPGSREEMDALDLPSAHRATHANTMASPDLPPQSPLLPSLTDLDVAIARSLRESNAEHSGDRPPDPSLYDMV